MFSCLKQDVPKRSLLVRVDYVFPIRIRIDYVSLIRIPSWLFPCFDFSPSLKYSLCDAKTFRNSRSSVFLSSSHDRKFYFRNFLSKTFDPNRSVFGHISEPYNIIRSINSHTLLMRLFACSTPNSSGCFR